MTIPVSFTYSYPKIRPPKSDLLSTKENKQQLVHAASYIAGEDHVLTEVELDFVNGSVILEVQLASNPDFSGSCTIDAVATKFFQEKRESIRNVNPQFIEKLENLEDTSSIEKITHIFYFAFNNYLQENPEDPCVIGSTVTKIRPGLKNPKINEPMVMDTKHWEYDDLPEFKAFIQSLPTSVLEVGKAKKISPFLQKALDQKKSYSEKILYLKQVIGLLLLQDVFAILLQDTKVSLAIEKQQIYSSRESDLSQRSAYYAYRMERVCNTLKQLPINTVLSLIPLACRSHPNKLSIFDLLSRDPEEQHPFVIESKYLAEQCNNAREADIAFRAVLEDSFQASPQKFFDKNRDEYKERIESFLMGVSGLAISPGLYGRLPMLDHKNIYYKRDTLFNIPSVSENVPCEFLMTAAQFIFEKEYNWIENSCFAYLEQMMGATSIYDLDAIKAKFQRIRDVVHQLPVENLLKMGSKPNSPYLLRNSGLKKLQSLYQEGRKMCGLQAPSREERNSSSCSIS